MAETTERKSKGLFSEENIPQISTMAVKLATSGFKLVLRFNIMMLLLAFNTAKDLLGKMASPFEPIAAEVRKVPKKDVSLEGAFYQFLRLQFLLLLLAWPYVTAVFTFMMQPLAWTRDWMIRFVQDDEKPSGAAKD